VGTLETDVLVAGAGPCGITVANLLGIYGVPAVVIDRASAILDYPRAVGVDDESLRTYQAAGLVQDLLVDIIQNTPVRYHTSWGRCFAEVKPSVQPFGWPRRNLFLQPLYEATLRRGVERFAHIDVRYGHELVTFDQDATGVTAQVKGRVGETAAIRARFLIGADGGRSTVRESAGVELSGTTAPAKWLVVDVADDELDAPYSAVYCDPVQPVLVVPLPYRHRRFEFKLQADDDEEEMTRPERALELVAPRYGSKPLPTIVRSRVYWHHSRIASTFQVGRVFLCGDAAHLQPPFFGQGMNSGIRDATNLSWKLAAVVWARAAERVLDTYDAERRSHAREMVDFATRIGRRYSPRSRATERVRDVGFRALQVVPGGKEYVLQMKYKPMPRYSAGVVLGGDERGRHDPVGRMFMQPVVETASRRREKLDDVIGPWFSVIGVHVDPSCHLSPESLAWWGTLGARLVRVDPPRSGPRPVVSGLAIPLDDRATPAVVVEDVDGAFRDWLLARPGKEVIILRPDRYVAAVCGRSELEATTRALCGLLTDEAGESF
jgi:3-(3-hydroxy-phenyl)propionate hydroxylase